MEDHPAFDERDVGPATGGSPERGQDRGDPLHVVPWSTQTELASESPADDCTADDCGATTHMVAAGVHVDDSVLEAESQSGEDLGCPRSRRSDAFDAVDATDATGIVLSRAFRAAFCASLPRSPLPESPDDLRDLVLGAAKAATIRVISDLRRMGSGPKTFPVEDAQAFIEDILHGARAVPGLGRIAANTVYAGLLASLPTDFGGVE